MSARILLVEDDPALLAMLQAAVAFGGFTSESVSRGAEAEAALESGGFDSVLLDLGLPDCEGGDLLRRLRAMSDIPIIVVSGRGTERDKIEALDLGADDYVPKPFLPGELLARIRAALRRYASMHRPAAAAEQDPARHPTRIGSMVLDPFHNSAALKGRKAEFNDAEFKILQLLASRAGETVSRPDLLEALYGAAAPEETRIVDVYISRIRAKLRDLAGDELIANVRGQGWRLMVPA